MCSLADIAVLVIAFIQRAKHAGVFSSRFVIDLDHATFEGGSRLGERLEDGEDVERAFGNNVPRIVRVDNGESRALIGLCLHATVTSLRIQSDTENALLMLLTHLIYKT